MPGVFVNRPGLKCFVRKEKISRDLRSTKDILTKKKEIVRVLLKLTVKCDENLFWFEEVLSSIKRGLNDYLESAVLVF